MLGMGCRRPHSDPAILSALCFGFDPTWGFGGDNEFGHGEAVGSNGRWVKFTNMFPSYLDLLQLYINMRENDTDCISITSITIY